MKTTCISSRQPAILSVLILLFPTCFPLIGDVLVLKSGNVISGEILQQDADSGVLIKLDYGTFTYPPSVIKDVQLSAPTNLTSTASGQRIPEWGQIVSSLAKEKWARDLKQVPATVIDTGIFKNVPYI